MDINQFRVAVFQSTDFYRFYRMLMNDDTPLGQAARELVLLGVTPKELVEAALVQVNERRRASYSYPILNTSYPILNLSTDGVMFAGVLGGMDRSAEITNDARAWEAEAKRQLLHHQFNNAVRRLEATVPIKPKQRVPDLVEPIVGWRAWLECDGGLDSLGVDCVWPAMTPLTAHCEGDERHPAPNKDCFCGIWAFSTLELVLAALSDYLNQKDRLIVGQVYLWGKVIECENGYRAQYAYPKELWLLNAEWKSLGTIYNVPVRVAEL